MEDMERNKSKDEMSDMIDDMEYMNENELLTPLLTENENIPQKSKLLGGLLAFLSSLLFTAIGVIVQQLSLNCSDVMFVRFSLQIILVSSIVKYQCLSKDDLKLENENHKERSVRLLIFQGLCNGICLMGEIICVTLIPIGDATSIIMSSPLPAMILSRIFLGHRLRLYKMVCGTMLYLGVVFVVQPPFIFNHLFVR
jgi:drug/metabolite transporter (DMT)-like permease